MAGNERLIAKAASAFNKARLKFTDASVEVHLLKPSEDANRDWEEVWPLATNWFFDSSQQPPLLYLAETAQNLKEPMLEATNIRIGEKVFQLSPDKVTPPDELGGPRPFWTIVCEDNAARNYAGL